MEKAASNKQTLSSSKLDLNLRKTVKCCVRSIALHSAVTFTIWKEDEKYLESCEAWCWSRLDRISWADK